jgi:hypothetical protein
MIMAWVTCAFFGAQPGSLQWQKISIFRCFCPTWVAPTSQTIISTVATMILGHGPCHQEGVLHTWPLINSKKLIKQGKIFFNQKDWKGSVQISSNPKFEKNQSNIEDVMNF